MTLPDRPVTLSASRIKNIAYDKSSTVGRAPMYRSPGGRSHQVPPPPPPLSSCRRLRRAFSAVRAAPAAPTRSAFLLALAAGNSARLSFCLCESLELIWRQLRQPVPPSQCAVRPAAPGGTPSTLPHAHVACGLNGCSREQWPQIMRLAIRIACPSVVAFSWHTSQGKARPQHGKRSQRLLRR